MCLIHYISPLIKVLAWRYVGFKELYAKESDIIYGIMYRKNIKNICKIKKRVGENMHAK